MDSSMYSTWLRISQGQAGWRSKAMHYEYVSIALQCAFPCIVSIFCEQRRGPTHGSAAMSREPWASTAIARPSKKSLGEVGHFDSQLQVLWDHMHKKTLQNSRLLPRHWPRAMFRQLRYNDCYFSGDCVFSCKSTTTWNGMNGQARRSSIIDRSFVSYIS